MQITIQGKGSLSLNQADFIAQGGEGAVYAKGDLACKIYNAPDRMLPVAKIRELAALDQPYIIRPQDILLNAQDRPIGYTMRRVRDALPLCQVFTRSFRERKGLTPDHILALVRTFQEGVQYVHTQGCLIVDLHEMNFLLDNTLRTVFFIDVDSYQTPGFPPTAVMDMVRDRHSADFNGNTDWFSFGIVTFQMFIGIHPYKGKHPTLPDLDERMQRNVSVLNRQVSVPQVCYPFDVIPRPYLDWYRAIFEEGKRLPPPSDLRPVVLTTPRVQRITGSGKLVVTELARFPAEIVLPIPCGRTYGAVTMEGLYIGGRKLLRGSDIKIGRTPRGNHLIAAYLEARKVRLYDLTERQEVHADIAGEALTTCAGRLYVQHAAALYEVEFVELPAGVRAALKPVGNTLENAAQVFEGVVMQSLLGSFYACLFPRPGTCYFARLPELDGYRVVEARFENKVLMVVGIQAGRYDKFVFRFDAAYRAYDLRVVKDIIYSGLNFAVLENGVCIHLNENEELELFSHRKDSTGLRLLADPAVQGVRLFQDGTQLLFARGDTLYHAAMPTTQPT